MTDLVNKGIWISDRDFRSFSEKPAPSLSGEIATRKRAGDVYGFGMYLPNPDEVLKNNGLDISAYRKLLYDPHLGSCIINRKAGVKSLNWSIDRAKAPGRVAKFIEDVFEGLRLKIDGIIGEILDAPLFGYQALEIMWEERDGFFWPVNLVGKPQEWFCFDPENRLQFRALGTLVGELTDSMKFILATHEATYVNPYGFPLLSRCFWPVAFKKGGWKFWMEFTEKYGGAFAIGKHPRGAQLEEINALADMLVAMVNSAIAVIPDDGSVEIKEASGKQSSADGYERLIKTCDTDISKALIGQTLTTEVGKTGSYAASQTHMEVRGDIVDEDKRLACQIFNALIRTTVNVNFDLTGKTPAPLFTMWADEDVDIKLSERDRNLASTGQMRFKKIYFMRAYDFKEDEIEEAKPAATPAFVSADQPPDGSSFSEPTGAPPKGNKALGDFLPPEAMQKVMAGMMQPVLDAVNKGEDFKQIMEKMVHLFPEMNIDKLTEILHRAIFASEVWGRLQSQKGN